MFTAIHDFGVELLISGHDHNYERFAPQDPAGSFDPDGGVRQFVVGTGGRSVDPISEPALNSEVTDDETYGVLELRLYENGYEWAFLAEPGASFTDSGRNACH